MDETKFRNSQILHEMGLLPSSSHMPVLLEAQGSWLNRMITKEMLLSVLIPEPVMLLLHITHFQCQQLL